MPPGYQGHPVFVYPQIQFRLHILFQCVLSILFSELESQVEKLKVYPPFSEFHNSGPYH